MNDKREYFRQRYLANREAILVQQRAYQKANPDVVKRAKRAYNKKHAVKLSLDRRERYAADPDRDYAAHRVWVEKNKGRRAAYMRAWRASNFDSRHAYDAAYRSAHRDERAANENARRARQIGNGGSHTREQWLARQELFGHRCGYCGDAARLTKDHAVPLARGGSDDISNIIPACLPCNRRKHVKTADEFRGIK